MADYDSDGGVPAPEPTAVVASSTRQPSRFSVLIGAMTAEAGPPS